MYLPKIAEIDQYDFYILSIIGVFAYKCSVVFVNIFL